MMSGSNTSYALSSVRGWTRAYTAAKGGLLAVTLDGDVVGLTLH